MLKFAWRWARVGDPVLVHDRNHPEKGLLKGIVTYVQRNNRITQLGVRITDNDNSRVIWPAQACVDPDPLDPDESCWTCDQQPATTWLAPAKESAA